MLLDDVGAKLAAAGIGTLDTDLFLGRLPESPAACVALIESPGLPPVRTMGNTGMPDVEITGIQVMVRDGPDNYAAARTKANDVFRELGSSGAETINSVRYLSFEAISSVFSVGPDDSDRVQVACNFLIYKAVSP